MRCGYCGDVILPWPSTVPNISVARKEMVYTHYHKSNDNAYCDFGKGSKDYTKRRIATRKQFKDYIKQL